MLLTLPLLVAPAIPQDDLDHGELHARKKAEHETREPARAGENGLVLRILDLAGQMLGPINEWDSGGILGLALDGTLGWSEAGGAEPDGFGGELRSVELTARGSLGDSWNGHLSLHSSGDSIDLEQVSAAYGNLPGHGSLHVGRMPLRFGSQMHLHVHELDYPNRPGMLGEYLGQEPSGTGVQYDAFLPSDAGPKLRLFLGAFSSLSAHGHENRAEDPHTQTDAHESLADPALSARLAGSTRLNEGDRLEFGVSWLERSEYSLTSVGAGDLRGLSNRAVGFDASYTRPPDLMDPGWKLGMEYLQLRGDLAGALDESNPGLPLLNLISGSRSGWFLAAERPLTEHTSAGVLLGSYDHLDEGGEREQEATLSWTWQTTDAFRLRLAVSRTERDGGDDRTLFLLQYTALFGSHDHDHGHPSHDH